MAKVYVCGKESDADVKIFAAKNDFEADLLYCDVSQEYQAKGDALWFFTDRDSRASVKVFWTDQKHKADLNVFKVKEAYKAKWRKSHKWTNRLS